MDRASARPRRGGTDGPLVVSAVLPEDVQAELDALRRRWFPPGRTVVGAHLTLFHAVPPGISTQVEQDLAESASRGPVRLRFVRVQNLGRGAAYAVDAPELVARHRSLQQAWWDRLTRQDQQPLHPHVTLQNKVDRDVARATVRELEASFVPFEVESPGYDLWRYDGGPWTHLTRHDAD